MLFPLHEKFKLRHELVKVVKIWSSLNQLTVVVVLKQVVVSFYRGLTCKKCIRAYVRVL